MSRENPLGYTPEDLKSEMDFVPRFHCPKCMKRAWKMPTSMHTSPTRLWRATTKCECGYAARWLIDPDKTVELQTDQMHRPIGF
jgi:hypothetical protein